MNQQEKNRIPVESQESRVHRKKQTQDSQTQENRFCFAHSGANRCIAPCNKPVRLAKSKRWPALALGRVCGLTLLWCWAVCSGFWFPSALFDFFFFG